MIDVPTTSLRQLREATERFLLPEGYRFSVPEATRYYQILRASGEPQRAALEATAERFNTQAGILKRIVCGTKKEEALGQPFLTHGTLRPSTRIPRVDGVPVAYAQALEAKASTPKRVSARQGR